MRVACFLLLCTVSAWKSSSARVVRFETSSAYHHITVADDKGVRALTFNGALQSQVSLKNPMLGHLAYTEYFHLPWLWNNLTNVLMIGLGGGSTPRSYQYYYGTNLTFESVEIDPVVVDVAKRYFFFKEATNNPVQISDGRMHLRRSQKKYDAILMDAYTEHRYGSFIPHHLVTQEFFELAKAHLSDSGVLAYNVVGTVASWRSDILWAVHDTMKTVFPHVYLFPVDDSFNVILIGSKSSTFYTLAQLQQRASELVRQRRVTHPQFKRRVNALWNKPIHRTQPPLILSDDFAPVNGLLQSPFWN